ncbi:MAG TPA: hypothetical protein VJP80_06270 [Candidatus Saccharimonadales bacterium]|nr:hypothetical protein [Candidatus Saccharimonadales bacterium]
MSFLESLFGSNRGVAGAMQSALELVTRTASLVSNPREVDPLLDNVREVTSRLKPGEHLSPADESKLFGVYLSLEQYLTIKEPLRSFTKDALRARITPALRAQLEAYEANIKEKEGTANTVLQ